MEPCTGYRACSGRFCSIDSQSHDAVESLPPRRHLAVTGYITNVQRGATRPCTRPHGTMSVCIMCSYSSFSSELCRCHRLSLHDSDSHDGNKSRTYINVQSTSCPHVCSATLMVHRLPYSITRNKGLNSPQVDTWVHRAPSAGNIEIINTRATARFAQSHLPQGNGIQDRHVQPSGFK